MKFEENFDKFKEMFESFLDSARQIEREMKIGLKRLMRKLLDFQKK